MCVKYYIKHSTYIISFDFPTTLEGRSYYYSHLTGDETKAQKGEVISPNSHSYEKILKHESVQRKVSRKWMSGKQDYNRTSWGKLDV